MGTSDNERHLMVRPITEFGKLGFRYRAAKFPDNPLAFTQEWYCDSVACVARYVEIHCKCEEPRRPLSARCPLCNSPMKFLHYVEKDEVREPVKNPEPKPVRAELQREFIAWAERQLGYRIDRERPVYLTVIPGNYEQAAGYVVTVQGSAVKATAVLWPHTGAGYIEDAGNRQRKSLRSTFLGLGRSPQDLRYRWLSDWISNALADPPIVTSPG